ncbi:MAG TPA: response regulator transcription factor [Terriglobia bacterium]|nr:response regulator transcription factor [Terriglobia bacterium]
MRLETELAETGTRILLVDDDEKFCRLLQDYLQALGYAVDTVHNGADGLQKAKDGGYSAVIMDVMMPGMNGMEVLGELRRHSQVPVLMLTALGDEPDRIAGLEVGADDYLPKTFSTRELLARLRAVLRRSMVTSKTKEEPRSAPVCVGPLWLDPAARSGTLADQPLVLTTVEYDILLTLARSAGRVKTREQLLLEVAERDFEVFDRSIDVHISSLRRKLGDDPKSPRFIQTVRGVGYCLMKPGTDLRA